MRAIGRRAKVLAHRSSGTWPRCHPAVQNVPRRQSAPALTARNTPLPAPPALPPATSRRTPACCGSAWYHTAATQRDSEFCRHGRVLLFAPPETFSRSLIVSLSRPRMLLLPSWSLRRISRVRAQHGCQASFWAHHFSCYTKKGGSAPLTKPKGTLQVRTSASLRRVSVVYALPPTQIKRQAEHSPVIQH